MCGIVAVVGSDPSIHETIEMATTTLAHRGPDARGIYHDTTVSLGHQRLAVIDPAGGAQPMRNENLSVTFNGMIYNHRALRDVLESHGAIFETKCDTEVLLHGFRAWGIRGLLERLNGMFAFALLDESTHTLYVARDRMGEKPLYYAVSDGQIVFASEIKALLPFLPRHRATIPDDWFVLESTLSDRTLFDGVKVFKPAHLMIVNQNGSIGAYEAYWTLPTQTVGIGDDEAIQTLRWLIQDAVQLRTQSDVPLAAYLSGGLDSSIICSIACPEHVFHSSYPDEPGKFSERTHAQTVANAIRAKLHCATLEPADIPEALRLAIYHLDQPISSSSIISSMNLARSARQNGFRVILNGQGADEIFGGYGRYVLMQHEDQLASDPIYQQYRGMARRFWSPRMFDPASDRYLELNQRVPPRTEQPRSFYASLFNLHSGGIVSKMGVVDIHTTLQDLITMDDRACGAHGIESRSPFLDHRIVEFGMQLPDRLKIRDGVTKWILRQAARDIVPQEIVNRPDKMGMVSPIGRWLRHHNDLSNWSSERVRRLQRRANIPPVYPPEDGDYDRRLSAQIMLELWLEQFIDN